MKYLSIAAGLALSLCMACNNNEVKEAVNEADSANEARGTLDRDSLSATNRQTTDTLAKVKTDESGSEFLVRAAAGGMAEVDLARMGSTKGNSDFVRRFSEMMIKDHEAANRQVEALAMARTVTLPVPVVPKEADMLAKAAGKQFDIKFMDQMVKDHKSTIDLFNKYSDKTNDSSIRSFIQLTLPTLRQHLDSAQAIQKILKKGG